jgi:hypothetical protein
VDDLFPQYRNVSVIKQQLNGAPAAVKAAIPNPIVGFTLFLASDSALDAAAGAISACFALGHCMHSQAIFLCFSLGHIAELCSILPAATIGWRALEQPAAALIRRRRWSLETSAGQGA